MENSLVHEIELYPLESFKVLLDHEVNRSRRYGHPITLLHIRLETDPSDPQTMHNAEVFAINILNIHLRETDIPCKQGNEFLVLMPSTDEQGGRIACERLEKRFQSEPEAFDKVSFKLFAFMGMATLPGNRSITSRKLLQNAAQALEQAQASRLTKTVIFSATES
jgi:GGDEF domain-containing protein